MIRIAVFFTFLLPMIIGVSPKLAQAEVQTEFTCSSNMSSSPHGELIALGEESKALSVAKSCLSGAGQGVWDATGGRMASISACLFSPINCLNQAGEAISQIFPAIKTLYLNARQLMGIPAELMSSLTCSIAAEMSVEVIKGFLTGGASAFGIAMAISRNTRALSLLASMLGKIKRLGVSAQELFAVIKKMSAEQMNKFTDLMRKKGSDDKIRNIFNSCRIA